MRIRRRIKKGEQVFTVGNEDTYDDLLDRHGSKFWKKGPLEGYSGGFALCSIEDAQRLIQERGDGRGWAVYELEAKWSTDTKPSKVGWWRGLNKDCRILRKVSLPE